MKYARQRISLPGIVVSKLRVVGTIFQWNVGAFTVSDVFIGGTNEAVGEGDFLHAVCTPAAAAGNGKKRGIEILRNSKHPVNEAGEEVDICTDGFGAVFFKIEGFRGEPLNGCEHVPFVLETFLAGQLAGAVF